MHCTVWCTQLWGTVEKNWVQLKRLNCLHFLNVIFLHCSFYCREKRDFVILYTFSEYYSMSKFSKHLNFPYKFMTTKKSMNSIPPKRHCILVTLKCYLIWILGVVSLGIFGMSEIWVQGLPMTTTLGVLSEGLSCSLPFMCPRRWAWVPPLGGKHASAQLREETEMGTKERLGGSWGKVSFVLSSWVRLQCYLSLQASEASNSFGKHESLQCTVPDVLLYSVLILR